METFTNEAKQTDALRFRYNRIDKMKSYFIKEIREGKIMSKRFKQISSISNYVDKSLLVIAEASGVITI